MIRIAICDDDANFCKKLEKHLYQNISYLVHITIFTTPFTLFDSIEHYDVLFLDYEMPHINGLDILQEIKHLPIIKIMISNYSHISFDTYQYRIFWFIRKENFFYDISQLLPHLHEELKSNIKKFVISAHNKHLSLCFHKINYITNKSNYIYIHTNYETYKIRSPFSSITNQFEDIPFVIPIYGVIVNLKYVEYIDFHQSTILLNNGKIFPISKSKKDEVRRRYAKFCNVL